MLVDLSTSPFVGNKKEEQGAEGGMRGEGGGQTRGQRKGKKEILCRWIACLHDKSFKREDQPSLLLPCCSHRGKEMG